MFKSLPKEIIIYALIPFVFIVLADVLIYFIMHKKENKSNEDERNQSFKYHYLIKISMMIAIAFILPLICGYTWWVIESFWSREIFFDNFAYIALIIFLSLCLLTLIIWIYLKALDLAKDEEQESEA